MESEASSPMSTGRQCDQPQKYRIRVKEHLSIKWVEWLQVIAMDYQQDGSTVMLSELDDQPALHGLLNKIRDLGLTLISVDQIPGDRIGNTENT